MDHLAYLEIIKLLPCSTQLSMKLQPLIKTKMMKNKELVFKLSDVTFIILINVRIPSIFGIVTFMSMINIILIDLSLKKL